MSIEGRPRDGFTLIELLVVIAIIAILGAMLMPAFATANDKSNITQCEAHLQHIGMALRMFVEDHGRYARTLQELYDRQYVDDESALYCTKTGKQFVYERPGPKTSRRAVVASCVPPDTESGQRPHGFGTVYVVLRAGGKVEEVRQ
ncbi:MAG: type II secretion system protein [Armatimonadota bacterium]